MFESGDDVPLTSARDIEKLAGRLRSAAVVGPAPGDGAPWVAAEIVDRIAALEALKAAAAAAQARLTEALDESVRAERSADGLLAAEQGRGIAAQVALLARRAPCEAASTRVSPRPWCTRCRTPWPPSSRVGSRRGA